ncbi:MAG: hypothetical protein A2W31_14965 [Planctomycetes bacterium RBG_16_64_10]|nr:MAG: hypothetical protein A2W31_14965 [Planctomycetes bacterium RBG_16_64_10]
MLLRKGRLCANQTIKVLNMKNTGLLLLTLLLAVQLSWSKEPQLPPNRGIELPQMWKFHPGDDQEWAKEDFNDADWAEIRVPQFWDSQGFDQLDGFAWYRVRFDLPADYLSEDLVAILGQINDADETFLNGQRIGRMGNIEISESAHKFTRKYPVPRRLLKPKNNLLAVRVCDLGNQGGIFRGPMRLVKKSNFADYQRPAGLKPPLAPKWAFEPWIWEDDENSAAAVKDLVAGYARNDIPVGVIIIDSPWASAYNTFEFDSTKYPDPADLIRSLHERNIKVVCWFTGMINTDAPTYDHARANNYFLNDGEVVGWWKGHGSHIDYTNPEAIAWWHRQMDKAFQLGIDGWKVDNSESYVPDFSKCFRGEISKREYTDLYYCDAYRYTVTRNPNAITLARSVDYLDREFDPEFSPVSCASTTWVGDQHHDLSERGLQLALRNIFKALAVGYAFVGSDIGGFSGGPALTKTAFLRWAQFSAFNPLMMNGGVGEHRPWAFDQETTDIYRYYAKLHSELVPYLYSYAVESHRTGTPIMRPCESGKWQFLLGNEFFISTMYQDTTAWKVELPAGKWRDYWDESTTYCGPQSLAMAVPMARYPIFLRSGAIIPLLVKDSINGHGTKASQSFLTLLVYPDGNSEFKYHPDSDSDVLFTCAQLPAGLQIGFAPLNSDLLFRIHQTTAPTAVRLKSGSDLPAWSDFDAWEKAATGWHFVPSSNKLLVKCGGRTADVVQVE